MKTKRLCLFVLFCMLFCMFANSASAVILTAGSATAIRRLENITIRIDVDESEGIACAVFRIIYDQAGLQLNTVDGSDFFNESYWESEDHSGTIMFCGANAEPWPGSGPETIVTLSFTVKAEAAYNYTIDLTQSNINNEAVQILTGANLNPVLENAYPQITITGLVDGIVRIDQDGDGMDDQWEAENAPATNPLDSDDGLDDFDNDGFSNLREYLSGTLPGSSASVPGDIWADLDGDSDCDGDDLAVLVDEFRSIDCSEATPCYADLNNDGRVDEIDLFLFTEDFGSD